MAEEDFFGAPPAEPGPVPQAAEDGGFTLLGEAEAPADSAPAFVGDVQDGAAGDSMGYAAFAAPPPADEGDSAVAADMMGFAAAPPAEADDTAPIILGGAPPAEDAPIILGGPPEGSAAAEALVEEESAEPKVPSAMQKFNEEWQETLVKRKSEEDTAKTEMTDAAKAWMEEFHARREMKLEAKLAKNREDEQAKLENIEADLENDNSWQRVNKMVDLTQDGADNGEDTKRMRDVFILLKNEEGLAAKVGA